MEELDSGSMGLYTPVRSLHLGQLLPITPLPNYCKDRPGVCRLAIPVYHPRSSCVPPIGGCQDTGCVCVRQSTPLTDLSRPDSTRASVANQMCRPSLRAKAVQSSLTLSYLKAFGGLSRDLNDASGHTPRLGKDAKSDRSIQQNKYILYGCSRDLKVLEMESCYPTVLPSSTFIHSMATGWSLANFSASFSGRTSPSFLGSIFSTLLLLAQIQISGTRGSNSILR